MYGLVYTYIGMLFIWILGLIWHWSIPVECFWFFGAFFVLLCYMASFMIEPQTGR